MSLNRKGCLAAGSGITASLAPAGTAIARNAQGGQTGQTYKSRGSPAATDTRTGKPPDVEKKLGIVTLRDLEAEAQTVMAPFGFAYVAGTPTIRSITRNHLVRAESDA
jgi:hypothetical protein